MQSRKLCVLIDDRVCVECGECNQCDLDPTKQCDNCMKCVRDEETDYFAIRIDGVLTPEQALEDEAGGE